MNRQIRFGEAFFDSQSHFNLTAGELGINDSDKHKSNGLLYPEAQLALDKEGQSKFELTQNAWKLMDLIDWKGTPARTRAETAQRHPCCHNPMESPGERLYLTTVRFDEARSAPLDRAGTKSEM